MRDWMGRWGGFGLIFAGWLLLTGLIPSAAGPADVVREALGGKPQPPTSIPGRAPALPLLPGGPRQGPLGEVPAGGHGAHGAHGAHGTQAAATPAAAPATPAPERIVIPRIGVDARVVDVGLLPSGEMETAANAAGRLAFSAQAGEAGNS